MTNDNDVGDWSTGCIGQEEGWRGHSVPGTPSFPRNFPWSYVGPRPPALPLISSLFFVAVFVFFLFNTCLDTKLSHENYLITCCRWPPVMSIVRYIDIITLPSDSAHLCFLYTTFLYLCTIIFSLRIRWYKILEHKTFESQGSIRLQGVPNRPHRARKPCFFLPSRFSSPDKA